MDGWCDYFFFYQSVTPSGVGFELYIMCKKNTPLGVTDW